VGAVTEEGSSGSWGAWGFAGVLLLVLVLTVLGSWSEITRSWGLSGEQGTLTVTTCERRLQPGGEEQRATCLGSFTPDSGGAAYDVEAKLAADPGDEVAVGADGPDENAYRSDLWGRWGAVALPLLPLAFLWLIPWVRRFLRTPGERASRGEITLFLAAGVAPAVVLLLLGGIGFLVAVATT
jgi:hypothetical protein